MTKILGLDLGTNSIGWAIRDTENDGARQIIDKGVRIFSEGVKSEKGIESSRAAERTGYRSARKIKYRRKLRKYETLKVLSLNAMCPLSVEEVEEWKKTGFKKYPLNPEFLEWLKTSDNVNPYYFRDKASKQKVSLFELGRALYHMAQRRGFLSNRLDQSAEGVLEEHCPKIEALVEDLQSIDEIRLNLKDYFFEAGILDENEKSGFVKDSDEGDKKLVSLYKSLLAIVKKNDHDFEKCKTEIIQRLNKKDVLGKVKGKIKDIMQAMHDGNFKTLGQYFYSLYSKEKIRDQYTSREEHYLEEFKIICKVQGVEGIDENEKLPEKKFSGLAKDLYKAIFFQRPLKSQKGLIGKCSFEKTKSRCAISHPDFEEYRMWTYLNTIKIGTQSEKTMRFLTQDEKLKLVPKFFRKNDFNFEFLAKELIEKGSSFGYYKSSKKNEFFYWFNYKPTDSVAACQVSASLKNVIGEEWKTKTFTYKTLNGMKEEVSKSVDYKDLWHLLSVATSDVYLFDYAKEKLGLDDKSAKAFSKIKLKKDFASLSSSAINKILPYLKEGLLYSHAVFMANIENIVDEHIWKDVEQRNYIKTKIAEILDHYTFEKHQLEIINGLLKESKEKGEYYSKEAESLYKKDLSKRLISFYKSFLIESELEQNEILENVFPIFIQQLKDYEFIKIKRLDEKVLEFLGGKNQDGEVFCNNPKRLKKLYHPSDIEVFKKKVVKDEFGNEKLVLGSPLTSSIKNPMAMRALHQLRKVLNALILEGQIDENTRVHIEMARELNDANKRKGIQDYQNENKKFRDDAIKEIKKLYFDQCHKEVEPTEDDILRYQLWLEQNSHEIYEKEGKSISICDIIGSNPAYDIEHTIPRSISQDNSQMNKTLCSPRFNREIKRNKMPTELSNYSEILPRVEHWKKEAEKLDEEIKLITRQIKAAATKEVKDKKIRRRHYLTLKRDYLQGKYDRFVWTEPKVGFKNSQISDTGIITKYAQAYLKSYFKRVESVKGGMVAEFRKQWGIQESYMDENGFKHYREKDRSKHTHHTIDAITIACMTKDKYDVLAKAWTSEDQLDKQTAKALMSEAKPWKTFKEDLAKIEQEILVSHYTPDNVKKQSKKIIRVRGKKQYVAEIERDANGKAIPKKDAQGRIIYKLDKEGKKIPRFQQGDTVRGSLHLSTLYGAVERENENGEKEIKYVVRKPITKDFSEVDLKNVVDEGIKDRIYKHGLKNVLNPDGFIILPRESKGVDGAAKDLNEMIIKKIRLYQPTVKNPLKIKEHSLLSKSRHKYKQMVYGQNEGNYCMAIYEGMDSKGKIQRTHQLINMLDAGNYFKLSNSDKKLYPIAPEQDEKQNNLKYILTKGKMVLLYDKSVNELFEMNSSMLLDRLFQITQLDVEKSAEIKLLHHIEAREKKEITESMGLKTGMKGGKNIGEQKKYPWIKVGVNSFDCLVEGYDFKITPSGKITFL